MSYKAIVSRIHVRPLPGSDNIQIGSCGPYQVIVGIGTQDGELGVFFESDGQLSEEFASKNDLVRRKDADGNKCGGMFEENRRVKSIKLRGAKSEGFWCPPSLLAYTGFDLSSLVEGFQFDELAGYKICNKYVTKATSRTTKSHRQQKDNRMFAKHIDTGMFRREAQTIPDGSLCYISEKVHGTSFRYGHVLDEQEIKRGWFGRSVAWLFRLPKTEKVWRHLIGSRNVILEHREGNGFYGEEDFRRKAVDGIALHKGEVIYGEIVGYTETLAPIMATQSIASLKDKSLKVVFGETIEYSYGCQKGECRLFVYRITQVNEDGYVVELSWRQVLKRCRELGLNAVPTIAPMVILDDPKELEDVVLSLTDTESGPHKSVLDERHIREGVVVRWESEHGIGWLKNKSFTFGVLEGYLKESDDFVDTEEAA